MTRKKLKPILKDGFNIEIGTLTKTELNDISILFHFFLKRGIHSQIQFNWLNKWQKKAEIPKRIHKKDITWHDMAHCAARYMLDPENNWSDPGRFTPTPLKYKYNGYAEHFESLSEELYAALWMWSGTWRGKQLFVLTVLRNSKSDSIDSFYRAYIEGCLRFNEFRVWETFLDSYVKALTLDLYKLPSYRQRALSVKPLRERIRTEEFPKLRELLEYVFDHQDDPRVLFDLFYKEMSPLIERLKWRAEYRQ